MPPSIDPNLEQLEEVAARLGPILDELMLVGGCATGLLITDPGAARVRTTKDVDFVVEATTYVAYEAFGGRLEQRGFQRSRLPGDPLCRWRSGEVVLDLMPLEERVLGFSNRWYRSATQSRMSRRLPGGSLVRHIDAPHFLATKLEAFASRGGGDPVSSHDLEDVARVVDGRESILVELGHAPAKLREYVRTEVSACLRDRLFLDALPDYFPREERAARTRIVLARFRAMADSRDTGAA